jgi:hypothetical protein
LATFWTLLMVYFDSPMKHFAHSNRILRAPELAKSATGAEVFLDIHYDFEILFVRP